MTFLFLLRVGTFLARLLPAPVVIGGAAAAARIASLFSPARRVVAANLAAIERARRMRQTGEGAVHGSRDDGERLADVAQNPAAEPAPHEAGGAIPARPRPGATRVRPADVFASYGRYWGEFLVLAAKPETLGRFHVRLEGEQHLHDAVRRGPVLILTGHLGNWDLGAFWMATHLGNFAVVAEVLRPASLFRYFTRARGRWKCLTLPANGSGLRLYRHYRRGGNVGMVADRPFGAGVRLVPFLQGRRAFPVAGIHLADRAGATILPTFLLREERGYVIRIHPPAAPGSDPILAFAAALEDEILSAPDQWCVLYPIHQEGEPSSPGL